jgi:Sulfotransferase domain
MEEVFAHPEQVPYWQAVAAGRPVVWDDVFAGYRSQVDWPGAHPWRGLAIAYPQSKVILSVRPEAAWWTSFSATIGALFDAPDQVPLPPHLDPRRLAGRAARK